MTGQKMRLLLTILDGVADDPEALLSMGVGTMAKATGMDERTVTTCRNAFVSDGLLERRGTVGKANAYRIRIDGMDDALRNKTPARARGVTPPVAPPARPPATPPAPAQGVTVESGLVTDRIAVSEQEHEQEHEEEQGLLRWNEEWHEILEAVMERANQKKPCSSAQNKTRRKLSELLIRKAQKRRIDAGLSPVTSIHDCLSETLIDWVMAQVLEISPPAHAETVLFTTDTISAFDADGTTFRHKTANLFARTSQLETT